MVSSKMSLVLSPLAVVLLALPAVRAGYDNDVDNAVSVLWTLEPSLAKEFCIGYTKKYEGGGGEHYAITVTALPTTVTADCESHTPYPPNIYTVSSTTTKYYTTTVTKSVPYPKPTDEKWYKRDEYCTDEHVPCRLVQYPKTVIAEACLEYLGGGKPATVTVPGPITTITKPCEPVWKPEPTKDYYGGEEKPEPPKDYYGGEEKPEPPKDYYGGEKKPEPKEPPKGGDGGYGYDGQDDEHKGELPESSEY